jgi:hypothetical protein
VLLQPIIESMSTLMLTRPRRMSLFIMSVAVPREYPAAPARLLRRAGAGLRLLRMID